MVIVVFSSMLHLLHPFAGPLEYLKCNHYHWPAPRLACSLAQLCRVHNMFFVDSVFVMGLGGGLAFPVYRTIAAALEPPAYQGKLQWRLLVTGLVLARIWSSHQGDSG